MRNVPGRHTTIMHTVKSNDGENNRVDREIQRRAMRVADTPLHESNPDFTIQHALDAIDGGRGNA